MMFGRLGVLNAFSTYHIFNLGYFQFMIGLSGHNHIISWGTSVLVLADCHYTLFDVLCLEKKLLLELNLKNTQVLLSRWS